MMPPHSEIQECLASDLEEVTALMASTFEVISKDNLYPIDPKQKLERIESIPLKLDTAEFLHYSLTPVISDLRYELRYANDSVPDVDGVHYEMRHHIHPESLGFLLKLYDKIWSSFSFLLNGEMYS